MMVDAAVVSGADALRAAIDNMLNLERVEDLHLS